MAWLASGRPKILPKAAAFVAAMQICQGWQAACAEEVADHLGCIGAEQLCGQASLNRKNEDRKYLPTFFKELVDKLGLEAATAEG